MTSFARTLTASTAIVGMLALAACEKPAGTPAQKGTSEGQPATITYACGGGESLTARYTDARTAIVTFRGETFTLTLAESASGSRFTGGGREWWTKAFPDREEGTLSPLTSTAAAGGPPIATCTKQGAGTGAPSPSQPTTPIVVPPTTTPDPVTPPVTVPVTPAAASAAPCRSGDLVLRRVSEEAGAGQRQVTYAFVNQARTACSLKGFATLQWLDANGKALTPLKVVQSEDAMFNTQGAPEEVTLAGGGRAVFYIAFTGIQQGPKACPASAKVQATPPGNSQILEIEDRIQPCTGQVRVGPIRVDRGDQL